MAPAKSDPASDSLIALFKTIGLSQPKAAEAAKSAKSAAILKSLIEEQDLASAALDEKQVGLIVSLSNALAKSEGLANAEKVYVVSKIRGGQLKSLDQINGTQLYIIIVIFYILACQSCCQIPGSTPCSH